MKAVIFDLDDTLIDSEHHWTRAKEEFAAEHGAVLENNHQLVTMGMAAHEWQEYMRDACALEISGEEIGYQIVEKVKDAYAKSLAPFEGAEDVLEELAERWPLAIASSTNREILNMTLDLLEWDKYFEVVVSSNEVGVGKPDPEVFLEVCRQLAVEVEEVVAVEDSRAGILAASSAGMPVIAIPKRTHPPDKEILERAAIVLDNIKEIDAELIESISTHS